MTQYQQTAEGGTDTVNITVGNSGGTSGQGFSLVSLGGSATATYSTVGKASGNLGYRLQSPGTATTDKIYLRTTVPATGTISDRIYFTINSATAQAQNIFNLNDGGAQVAAVGLLGNMTLRAVSAAGATLSTSPVACVAGTLYRLEWYWAKGTTTTDGTMGAKLFQGDSTSALWTYTANNVNVGTTNVVYRNIGGGISSNVIDLTVDTMLLDDSQAVFLGPPTAAPTNANVPDSVVSAPGWTAFGAADIPSALSDSLDSTGAQTPDGPGTYTMIVGTSGTLAPGNVQVPCRGYKRDNTSTVTCKITLLNSSGAPVSTEQTYTLTTTPAALTYNLTAAENAAWSSRAGSQWRFIMTVG